EDVGLPRGPRRRTGGLRREEVAALAGISADYYHRIEQRRGSMPSGAVLGALAVALRLSLSERDHLYRLAGLPERIRDDHPGPVMVRIVGGLADLPAVLFSRSGAVLLRTRPAVALLGDRGLTDLVHQRGLWRFRHPRLGELELYCTRILDPVQSHLLLVLTAEPGSPSHERLRLLAAVD
ncbi:MmyB family transcriptional regulator, partial [Actinoplanes philippinensis]|uniref:MmyB family transcriptional regulator n=1 Tax=Actinoplanes philippinensis TaxID=35752 RepID=UPI0033EE61D4